MEEAGSYHVLLYLSHLDYYRLCFKIIFTLELKFHLNSSYSLGYMSQTLKWSCYMTSDVI